MSLLHTMPLVIFGHTSFSWLMDRDLENMTLLITDPLIRTQLSRLGGRLTDGRRSRQCHTRPFPMRMCALTLHSLAALFLTTFQSPISSLTSIIPQTASSYRYGFPQFGRLRPRSTALSSPRRPRDIVFHISRSSPVSGHVKRNPDQGPQDTCSTYHD